jgi:hypothetical protein
MGFMTPKIKRAGDLLNRRLLFPRFASLRWNYPTGLRGHPVCFRQDISAGSAPPANLKFILALPGFLSIKEYSWLTPREKDEAIGGWGDRKKGVQDEGGKRSGTQEKINTGRARTH